MGGIFPVCGFVLSIITIRTNGLPGQSEGAFLFV